MKFPIIPFLALMAVVGVSLGAGLEKKNLASFVLDETAGESKPMVMSELFNLDEENKPEGVDVEAPAEETSGLEPQKICVAVKCFPKWSKLKICICVKRR